MKRSNLIVGLLSVLVVFMVAAVFKSAYNVVIPLMIAWLLSYICGPAVNYLVHRKVPLALAVFAVLMLVLFIFYSCGIFLVSRVREVLATWDANGYTDQLYMIYQRVLTKLYVSEKYVASLNWDEKLTNMITTLSTSAAQWMFSFLGRLLLVLIFLVFLLLGKPYFKYKVEHAFPPDRGSVFTDITESISRQIGQYLVVKLIISGITAFLVWTVLSILKVDFALTWAALAFFLNFIPTIGSIIASIPPVLVAIITNYDSPWVPFLAALFLLLIQMVMGNIIEPKVMGDHLNLSPVVILLSLALFGWMWGVVGALLSVPIAAAIKIFCENIEALKPISVMMGSGKQLMKASVMAEEGKS
ncbi:MAG: AI-2E family transporter [Pontiellaceae bacterium]|nr:AI-2E family transporter [Pontiellaceae bacterium]